MSNTDLEKKSDPEIVCCLGCGRDTMNQTGYCNECFGRGKSALHEQRGRRLIKSVHGNPIYNDIDIDNPAEKE